MSNIKVMSQDLSNKIAAGEVIESIVNVVKELVENSIDANSTKIEVNLKEAGLKEIEVVDNGNGMNKEDLKLCTLRHATSKIDNVQDLFYIQTLGFRGEALPSIESVSKLIIKTSDGENANILENGKIKTSSRDKGTTIIVKDLFYNTPVRLKYLKNTYIELSKIIDYMEKISLSYTNISFILRNDDKVILNTQGNNDLLKVIYNIYGNDISKKMIEINKENDDFYISGYISYPEVVKSNSSSISIFVNGRVIKNYELNKCILESYHTYIHKGKYPYIILKIDVDPTLIDINIHPTKMDIKFSKMDSLKDLITLSITEKLTKLNLVPNYSTRVIENTNFSNETFINKDLEYNEKSQKIDFSSEELNIVEENNTKEEIKEDEEVIEEIKQPRIKMMEPKAILFLTYIVAENEDGMFLIDQHAAAERYNYEKFLKEMSQVDIKKTDLLVPIKIELKKSEFIIAKKNIELINNIGIICEEFGDNTFIVRSIPLWLKNKNDYDNIKTIFDIVVEKEDFSVQKFIEKTATIMSCRLSVKAHDFITIDEARLIINNLRYCNNPFTCPHGRPTIISYSKDEIDKMFKRDYKD